MPTSLLTRSVLAVLLMLGAWLPVHATHVLGGELTYTYIEGSASQYKILGRIYARDPATGVPDQPFMQLDCSLNGCSLTTPGSFSVRVNRVRPSSKRLGCAGSAVFLIGEYEAIVTLPPGQWKISSVFTTRGGTSNLTNPSGNDLYLSAFLDNSSGSHNSSPRFTSFTLPYNLAVNQPYRYSFSAFEPDGDSLVYRAVQPATSSAIAASSCGTPIQYTSYPAGQFQDPTTGQMVSYPAGQFTVAFPLLSFQTVNAVAVPQFNLNATTGELLTTPVTQVGDFSVPVQIDEYRRLNGAWTLIGQVTRDVPYGVRNPSTNRNPTISSLKVAGAAATQPIDQPVAVRPGQSVSLTLTATDPDAGQMVQLSSDVAAVVPGASFQAQGTNQGVLTWQVPAALPLGRYTVAVTVADNNCPLNGHEVRTITFLVSNQILATHSSRPRVLSAYPVPFHDRVQFQLPTAAVQSVTITDNLGRLVTTLKSRPDGSVEWLPSTEVVVGTYFARPTDGSYVCRLLRQ
ncbi:hypothetical protein [Hymenobacter sp. YC55]|uniref:hypothetical protein n=1 Tax=Hymenobacter sp. YC55 TaxID=3034019 RepID=UPI0023F9881B|nr:hypothetical protein [Hymenobacter sp. YC55]MDF7813343.1 hypothetical protein [Hymenobacter sp. YC55]